MEDRFEYQLKAFGQRVKQLRKKKGMSQLDIETETGITNADISRIENGLKNIEFLTILKLAKALGVEPYELFTSL